MKCKITGKKIIPFMSFGKMPIANGFLNKNDFKKEFFYELKVGFSEKFSLFQLDEYPSIKKMFHKNYPFYTSSSNYMIKHFKDYAHWSKKYLNSKSKIIELGSNDGTFLKNFKNTNIEAIGFEPSKNVSDIAKKKGIKSINRFFNSENISDLKDFKTNTDLICGANVVCHIPDLINLFNTVDKLLSKDGVFVFEEPYLGSVYEKNSYDQIYDEHIYIFSGVAISKIAAEFDLKLIDLIPQPTHGGSMRYVVCRKNSKKSQSKNVNKIISYEKILNIFFEISQFFLKFLQN